MEKWLFVFLQDSHGNIVQINADASQLEWRIVVHQANDKVGIQEIADGVDFHQKNKDTFKLPTRLISKIFLFRAIFRGSAYAYSVDPDFSHLGGEKFWQAVIDRFYEKYTGIYDYHQRIIGEAVNTGKVVVPDTGRVYVFEPKQRRGDWVWPETDIVNYPVQGGAADVMAIIRTTLRRRLMAKRGLVYSFCNTVHDSVLLDVDNRRENWYNICIETKKAFDDAGKNFKLLFGSDLRVPMACEIKIGNNWAWLHKLKLEG